MRTSTSRTTMRVSAGRIMLSIVIATIGGFLVASGAYTQWDIARSAMSGSTTYALPYAFSFMCFFLQNACTYAGGTTILPWYIGADVAITFIIVGALMLVIGALPISLSVRR